MKLTAVQKFTDKQGRSHEKNESFEVQNDQEAQEYIRQGQAKEEQGQSQTSGSGGSRSRNE